ncbi:enhancer of mRNA decapping [Podila horticola]|nr:enhancer of mRNA decapping [Podila horticola]
MAAAFIGLSVKVLLNNGMSLKGHVADVDQITQRLMLQDVVIQRADEKTVRVMPSFSIAGGEIKDLQVLPTQPAVHPPPTNSASPSASSTVTSAPHLGNGHHPHQHQHSQQHSSVMHLQHEHVHAPLVAPSPRQLPAHPHPSAASSQPMPYHDPAIISFTHPNAAPKPQFEEAEVLIEQMKSTRINKSLPQHQHSQHDHLTVAESSATESVSRGPRRARKTNNNNQHGNNRHSNNYNNHMSDYGSPRMTYQSASGKKSSKKFKEPVHEWAQGDMEEFKDEDFDFQANLGLFDKARVFAEIREADDTAPELLLVNLNRNPNRARAMEQSPMLRKLAPNENVLDPAPKRFYNRDHGSGMSEDEEDEVDDSGDDSWNSSSPEDSSTVPGHIKSGTKSGVNGGVKGSPATSVKVSATGGSSNNGSGADVNKKRPVKIQTLSGVSCPAVSIQQMQEVERLSATEMGLSEEQQIENGGRGAAMMCLQALGGSRRIQPNNHNSAPVVVIMAGNNRTGAYAICAARHLSNHGCQVMAFIACSADEGQLVQTVASQSRGFVAAGGELIHSIQELPQANASPVDLIMDGMLGYQHTVRDIVDAYERETICDLMDWANDNKAPVLSLDMPSGVNGTTGHGDKTKFCVRPKWTLCLGAPKTGCRSRATTGELFLTDLGIPRTCWKRAGVKGWGMPWGADFLVGLEYL